MIKQNGQSGLAATSIFNEELIPCHPGLDVLFSLYSAPTLPITFLKTSFPGPFPFRRPQKRGKSFPSYSFVSLAGPFWCRRHTTRHNRTLLYKPIVFIVLVLLLKFHPLLFYINFVF